MKSLLVFISLLSVGCTTVYKVDANGVCRAPNGKIVKESKIDPDRYIYNGPCYVRQPYDSCGVVNGGSELGQHGTAYGW